jgi:mono/diheme cytochrome c family protein
MLAGCDWSLHRMMETPGCDVHRATDLLPGGACDLEPPEGVVAMTPPAEPPPVTRAVLERGYDRFEKICAACHGVRADGVSYVGRAMTLRRPPSLVDASARKLADDRILTIITSGYGLMPSYASIAPADRYAILYFVRAMQRREVTLAELPAPLQAEAKQWLP